MHANRIVFGRVDFFKQVLAHRHFPAILALMAVTFMAPALKLGLIADDLPQRAIELRPGQLPPRMAETGNPADSGKFSTVLFDLFCLARNPASVTVMRDYGALPWWTPDDLKCSLCRPVAAFTHWIDYHLFPDSPALMHAHNIAWFAAVIFAAAMVYRKLLGTAWAAGLAALLFLLDANTYFPAAFVANRGYFLALFFGLLSLYEHHQWRSKKSRSAMLWSALFLVLSLLGEESGASMFAFILAYALVLETGNIRRRALTLLPSVLVISAWWILYRISGYGLNHIGLYLDPAHDPLGFLRALIPRDMILLGSQLTSVPPEICFPAKTSLLPVIIALYGVCALAALAIFLPWARRDKMTAFWFIGMIVAAVPEAVLLPLSKNFGYIAFGAFGLIASFVAGVIARPNPLLERRAGRMLASAACVVLLLVHGPGAIAKRIAMIKVAPRAFEWAGRAPPEWQNLGNQNLIVVNHPLPLESYYVPSYAAYYHRALPKTLRVLTPACTSFEIRRTDDKTLVIQSRGSNIFSCDNVGFFHLANALSDFSTLVGSEVNYKKGDQYQLKGLTVEILEVDASALPARVAFHFDTRLESPDFRWFWFDWRTRSTEPFTIPAIGQTVTLPGPLSDDKRDSRNSRSQSPAQAIRVSGSTAPL